MGGAWRERRAAAAAAEEALRRGCEEVLRVEVEEGNAEKASNLALLLVDKYPKSAAPCNLVGLLMAGAAGKIRDQLDKLPPQDPLGADADASRIAEYHAKSEKREAARSHLANCREGSAAWFGKAANLAPRCPFTRANYARSLEACDQTAEAYREYNAAVHITNPDIPERNNPWVRSGDLVTDEEKKASAMAMAEDDFRFFLHVSDTRVYTSCRDLLYNLRTGTPGVKARKEAKDLAAKYPFSARANLLAPFLTRLSIEKSSSSVPKTQQYQLLLREIVDCLDMFPSSVVVSLFRAEVLFAMGRYHEAAVECSRGIQIKHPDDPVSQAIPPDSTLGSGRTGRIRTFITKLIELLEQSREKVSDAEQIKKLQEAVPLAQEADATNCLVKRLVEDLNRSVQDLNVKPKAAKPNLCGQNGSFSKKQSKKFLAEMPEEKNTDVVKGTFSTKQTDQVSKDKPTLNIDASKGDDSKGSSAATLKQSYLYGEKKQQFTNKKIEETVRPLQIVGERTVPSETVELYADYCSISSVCSIKKEICHLCVFEDGKYYVKPIIKGNMTYHCWRKHKTRTIKCDVNLCDARFRTQEEKDLHNHYCHVLGKDWWKQW